MYLLLKSKNGEMSIELMDSLGSDYWQSCIILFRTDTTNNTVLLLIF